MNAYLEAAAHRCTMAGALELIVALDTFDFMRVKRRLRARHSQLSVRMMEALHLARPLAKPKERRGLAIAMQAFIDEELPRIEAARSTKVEARVLLHLTPPEEAFDETLKQALQEDIEDWLGVGFSGSTPRFKVEYVASSKGCVAGR